jgi:hypothetical protein
MDFDDVGMIGIFGIIDKRKNSYFVPEIPVVTLLHVGSSENLYSSKLFNGGSLVLQVFLINTRSDFSEGSCPKRRIENSIVVPHFTFASGFSIFFEDNLILNR